MRRIATLAVTVLIALAALGAVRPAAAHAAAPVTFGNAVTDNYKAIWNADPEIRENRTWFAFDSVTVGGVVYRPTTLPAGEPRVYTADQTVTGSDGSSAVVRVAAGADVVNKPFRTESTGTWGPLLVLRDTATLQERPVRITISVERDGAVLGSSVVEYRYEDAIYNAPRDDREYNSPGGRFWIGCDAVRLDWQDAAPAGDCAAPAGADLSTTVKAPAKTSVGTPFTATFTVTNTGDSTAEGVETGSDITFGLSLVSATSAAGSCSGNSVLVCSFGRLAAGASAVVRVKLVPVVTHEVNLNASVSATTPDPVHTNNTGGVSITAAGVSCTIIGTNGAEVLRGTAGRDVLCGLGGNDRLVGAGANDVLYGGTGRDSLEGGAGDDVVAGGSGLDRITFAGAAAGVVINMGQMPHPAWDGPSAGHANIGWDEVTSVEAATGSRFADQLVGSARNDRLAGAGGADVLHGLGGADALHGGAATDRCDAGGDARDSEVSCEG